MANNRFESLTNDELLGTYYEMKDATQFGIDEDILSRESTVQDLADELVRRKMSKSPARDIPDEAYQAANIRRGLPEWISKGIEDASFTVDPFTANGVVERRTPRLANVGTGGTEEEARNTLLHELAHVRQLGKAQDVVKRDPNAEGFTQAEIEEIVQKSLGDTGYKKYGDRRYYDLLENFGKSKALNRATNYADNPLELFANVEADLVESLMKGKPIHETERGKELGLEDETLRKYVYDKTLLGVPKVNSLQEPTWQEKMQNTLDKYRRKFLHRQ